MFISSWRRSAHFADDAKSGRTLDGRDGRVQSSIDTFNQSQQTTRSRPDPRGRNSTIPGT
jgi:hypothetical protein